MFTLVGRAQQPPIAGIPNITWSMSPDQVQQIAPGQMSGQMLFYEQTWQTYPVSTQYFFAQEQLVHVTLIPRYTYENGGQWQQEYQQIGNYLSTQYGDPYQQQQNIMIWRPESIPTQATTILYPQGWSIRFEQYQPQR